MPVPSLVVRTRAEFDNFWVSGVEHALLGTPSIGNPDEATGRQLTGDLPAPPDSFISDPSVTAQVWWNYASVGRDTGLDLLIDPSSPSLGGNDASALDVGSALKLIEERVIGESVTLDSTQLAGAYGCIAITLTYEQMVTRLLPLTTWGDLLTEALALTPTQQGQAMRAYRGLDTDRSRWGRIGWFLHLLVVCDSTVKRITYGANSPAFARVAELLRTVRPVSPDRRVGRVTLNRPAQATVSRSQRTVKADAARNLFGIRCDSIRWAVVDGGIDARHEWFRLPRPDRTPWEHPFENDQQIFNFTRVAESYDFTRLRTSGTVSRRTAEGTGQVDLPGDVPIAMALGDSLYEPPAGGHGTHVAGIIGGSGGLCPDIRLYDYRVLDETGHGSEFAVVAALRHILELTQRAGRSDPTGRKRDLPIHGVNLSLALDADVTSDACGWSMICRVCDELVRAGVVVVVAAGNTGFEDRTGAQKSTGQDYRTVSITDPGNTERVITVGSTDADRPREYGVSYFSARGPTADGRNKPDLVAPGSRITSAYGYLRGVDDYRDATAILSGTSQAAAHVSGCAALLMARHRELIGKPDEVKRVLRETATDLSRDVNFQGSGLVDALRAVQSI